MEDRWTHKSATMICKTCMWYVNMRCRHHSPTLKGWPAVYETDWCGDHKLDKETMQRLQAPTEIPPADQIPHAIPCGGKDGGKRKKD